MGLLNNVKGFSMLNLFVDVCLCQTGMTPESLTLAPIKTFANIEHVAKQSPNKVDKLLTVEPIRTARN
jgi:hypothetical protein